jgi:hypothetical protein
VKRIFVFFSVVTSSLVAHANWEYRQDQDQMSGKTAKYAEIESSNTLSLAFPYSGKNKGYIQIRQHPKYGQDAILSVEKGQFLCPSYSGCEVSVKFDEKPPVRYSGNGSADHDSKVIFIGNAARFIGEAKKAKRILIQASMYQSGSPIIEFNSGEPLVWGTTAKSQNKK